MKDYIFTSESVTEGHPDKICDQIADAIVDAALAQDPYSNMAVECTIKDDFVLIYGECNTKAELDYETIALNEIKRIGYTEEYHVHTVVNQQSPEIHNAVNRDEVCAGDQGIMFVYACDEIKRIDTIVVSTQHSKDITQEEIKKLIMDEVIKPCIDEKYLDENTKYFINPSGSFVVGGSWGDSGTTGRKIVCDTYGGRGRIGGGCFSSKDPTKVDRSAAYYSRYVAKNIVANGLARRCEVEVAYAIGKAQPVSLCVDTFGTGKFDDEKLLEIVKKNFNFEVGNIISELDLRKPVYHKTSCYGHFGDPQFTWEKVKKLEY